MLKLVSCISTYACSHKTTQSVRQLHVHVEDPELHVHVHVHVWWFSYITCIQYQLSSVVCIMARTIVIFNSKKQCVFYNNV